ncbi:MAG TPA: asparagine synthase (glutamine-hydrolyzing) [Chitinophagaceae bacterium]|nr:asparagine synthase (glutamine-hydrolyzing) [Chitinophagaceae bacterium]
MHSSLILPAGAVFRAVSSLLDKILGKSISYADIYTMCGIAGIISPYTSLVQQQGLTAMADALVHRGPESAGYWVSEAGNVGFAHRRLSIIDLHERAAQPFRYLHYVLVFNGEIYNYIELKEELEKLGYIFTTGADTEVIPAAFDYWGMKCLDRFDGMFAFALWDEKQQQLVIARDRFGEKPLYYYAAYGQRGKFDQLIFGSEMKALWAVGTPKHINGTMLLNYITLGYVQDTLKKTATFYNDILSLPAGHYLTIQPQQGRVQMKKWYDGIKGESTKGEIFKRNTIVEQFGELLSGSIRRRLRSDVNIGTCLSGGIDSSTIVAVCNSLKAPHLTQECFTAIFPGFEKDESFFSSQVANHFNLRQHTVEVRVEDWINNFNLLMYHQEEPLQSSSVLAQFMVYKLAKQHGVTVLLDGQGADEILGGYKKYTHWFLQQLLRTDLGAFRKEKKLLEQNNFLESWGIKHYAAAFFPQKAAKLLQKKTVMEQNGMSDINADFLKKYQNIDTLQKPEVSSLEDILYYNTFRVGLGELLRYADRNSMAHSREVRLPFLDHTIVEFIFSLLSEWKIHNGFTKWILRQYAEPLLPADIVWRKDKIGYEPPQKQWMQNGKVQEMIMEARRTLVQQNVLDKAVINKPVKPSPAHERENDDWRYLCSACLL